MKPRTKPFALCVDNTDYEASLIPGKVYRVLTDPRSAKDDLVRIVDERGEDYLYHKSHFVFVDLSARSEEENPGLGERYQTSRSSGRPKLVVAARGLRGVSPPGRPPLT